MSNTGSGPHPSDRSVQARSSTPVLSIVSFVLSAIAVFFIPILFGGAAIVTAAVAMSKNERLGKVALVVAIVATIVGFVLGFMAANAALQG